MDHPEFTLLGDAVWLDFVNTALGRVPNPPDLLPDATAFARWAVGRPRALGLRAENARRTD